MCCCSYVLPFKSLPARIQTYKAAAPECMLCSLVCAVEERVHLAMGSMTHEADEDAADQELEEAAALLQGSARGSTSAAESAHASPAHGTAVKQGASASPMGLWAMQAAHTAAQASDSTSRSCDPAMAGGSSSPFSSSRGSHASGRCKEGAGGSSAAHGAWRAHGAAMQVPHAAQPPLMMHMGLPQGGQQETPSLLRSGPSTAHAGPACMAQARQRMASPAATTQQSQDLNSGQTQNGRQAPGLLFTSHASSPPYHAPDRHRPAVSPAFLSSSPAQTLACHPSPDQSPTPAKPTKKQPQPQWSVSYDTPARDGDFLYSHTRFVVPPPARRRLLPELESMGAQPQAQNEPPQHSMQPPLSRLATRTAESPQPAPALASAPYSPPAQHEPVHSANRGSSPFAFARAAQQTQPHGTPCSQPSSSASSSTFTGNQHQQPQPTGTASNLSSSSSPMAPTGTMIAGSTTVPASNPQSGSPVAGRPHRPQPVLQIDSPQFTAYRQVLAMRQAHSAGASPPSASSSAASATESAAAGVRADNITAGTAAPCTGGAAAAVTGNQHAHSPPQHSTFSSEANSSAGATGSFGSPATQPSPNTALCWQQQQQQLQQQHFNPNRHTSSSSSPAPPTPDALPATPRAASLPGSSGASSSQHLDAASPSSSYSINSLHGRRAPHGLSPDHASMNGSCSPSYSSPSYCQDSAYRRPAAAHYQASPTTHQHAMSDGACLSSGYPQQQHHYIHTSSPVAQHQSPLGEAANVLAMARQQKHDLVDLADRTIQMWKAKWAHAHDTAQALQQQLEELGVRCETASKQAQDAQAVQEAAEKAAAEARKAQADAEGEEGIGFAVADVDGVGWALRLCSNFVHACLSNGFSCRSV